MNISARLLARLVPALAMFVLCASVPAADVAKPARAPIYDEQADGKKQIADALTVAKKENKRVLLQFGANWCGWCHRLHALFKTNSAMAAVIKESYVVVLIDVNEEHNEDVKERFWGKEKMALPAIVILDANGKVLKRQDTGELEEGKGYNEPKVLEFLKTWKGKASSGKDRQQPAG